MSNTSRIQFPLPLLFLVFLFPLFAQAQKVYKPGYVVLKEGDTLRGQLMNFVEKEKSERVQLQDLETGEVQYFVPHDLQGYEIGGERYRSATVLVIEDYDPQITLSTPDFVPSYDSIEVFLAVLLEGEMSLFRLTTPDARELLYASNPSTSPQPLLSLSYEYYDAGTIYARGTYTVAKDEYKLAISDLMVYCAQLYDKVANLRFSIHEISRFMEDYHRCVHDEDLPYEFPQTREIAIQIGPVVEGFQNTHQFEGSGAYWFDEEAYEASQGIALGLGIEFTLKRNNDQVSLYTGATVREITQSGEVVHENIPGDLALGLYERFQYEFSGYVLEMPLEFRYNLPLGKIKPFALAGVNLNITRLNQNFLLQESYRNNELFRSTEDVFIVEDQLAQAGYTFRIGAGIKGEHWFVSARYQPGHHLAARYSIVRDQYSSIFVSAGWMFGRP